MDRDALARAARRAQAVEALEFERERETELRRQIAEVVLEQEGERLNAAALAGLDEEDVRRVRAALGDVEPEELEDEDPFTDDVFVELDFDDEPSDDEPVDEVARLEREIEESRRIQSALERFVAALDDTAAAEAS